MKPSKKRFLSTMLALALAVGLLLPSVPVQAAAKSGMDGDIVWEISGSTLTLSGVAGSRGKMKSYSYSAKAPWQSSKAMTDVKKVIIEDSVKELGSLAFYGDDIHLESMQIAGSIETIREYFCKDITIDKLYLCDGIRSIEPQAFLGVVREVYAAASLESIPLPSFGINNREGNGTVSYVTHVYGYTDGAAQAYAVNYLEAIAATNRTPNIWSDGKKYALDANEDGIADANPKIVFTALDKSSVLKKATVTSSVSVSVGKTQKLKVTVPSYLTLVTKYSGTEGEVKATYKSKNSKIATVDKNGKVTGKKKGTTTITTTLKLKNGTKKTFTTKVTVK